MPKSPFLKEKIEFSRELTAAESIQATISDSFKEWLTGAISNDSIKQLPPKLFFPVALMIQFIVLTYVIQAFITGYFTNINTQFLSPSTSTSKYCNPVPLSNTGQYLATQSGQWQGATDFSYSLAAYQLTLNNYETTAGNLAGSLLSIGFTLSFFGNLSTTQDLSLNLLYWTSFVIAEEALSGEVTTSNRFNMVGTPLSILNRQYTFGMVGNRYGLCNASSVASFDTNSGILSVSFVYDEFVANPICNASINPSFFNYLPKLNKNSFTISLDSRTVFTAVAVNNGLLQLSYIEEVTQKRGNISSGESIFLYSSFYDPKYPGMALLYCVYDKIVNGKRVIPTIQFCVIPVGSTFVMPLFNHMGIDHDLPKQCNCTEVQESKMRGIYYEDEIDTYGLCSAFRFLTGFIYSPSLTYWFENYDRLNGYNQISQIAYNASFMTSSQALLSIYSDELIQAGELRKAAFDFCDSAEFGNCSLVMFSSFDTSAATNWAVSEYYYQLPFGACADTISVPGSVWESLAANPYASLVQDYEVCKNNPRTVFQTQLGSASGSIALIAPLAAITMLILLFFYQVMSGVTIPKSYARSEKDAAIEALSV
eukprot:gene13837-18558_t